jgi:hypothetical protein
MQKLTAAKFRGVPLSDDPDSAIHSPICADQY